MKKIFFLLFTGLCFSTTQVSAADISCSPDHYKSGSICKPCSEITPNCKSCSSSGKCTACEADFTLSGGKCVASYNTSCSYGYDGYSKCYKCDTFSSVTNCKNRTANAASCFVINGCYRATCQAGYVASQHQWAGPQGEGIGPGCNKCIDNCNTCPRSSSRCFRCKSGYYYSYGSYGNGSCKVCPSNASCDGINVSCKSGYYLEGSLRTGYSCQPCPENATCSNNEITCNSSYDLSDGKCERKNTVSSCPAGLSKSADGCCCVK